MGPLTRLALLLLVAYLGWRWLTGRGFRVVRQRKPADPRMIEDMTRCPSCGVFVSTAAGRCARADCPRRPRAA